MCLGKLMRALKRLALIPSAVGAHCTLSGCEICRVCLQAPAGQTGAARAFEHPCALREVRRKRDRELSV